MPRPRKQSLHIKLFPVTKQSRAKGTGINPGRLRVTIPQILGHGPWGLHEILLYPVMYSNMR